MNKNLVVAPLLAAIALSACEGSRGGGCMLPPSAPALAGTPIPTQPLPANTGITSNVTVIVTVQVQPDGTLTSAAVTTGSGNATVDQDALTIVRNSAFRGGFPGCGTSVPTQAAVSVTFRPGF